MNIMSWQYIAGFFDGEGCLCIRQRSHFPKGYYSYELSISQAFFQAKVINDIKTFLDGEKIHSNIYYQKKGNRKHGVKRLVIGKIREIKNFIDEILPYLIVKKEKCKKFLDDFEGGIINKNANLSLRNIETIKRLVKEEENTVRIGKEINSSYETVRAFLIKNKINWVKGKKKNGIWSNCPICKSKFYVIPSCVKRRRRIFCSKKCYAIWQKGKKRNSKFNFSSKVGILN